MEVAHQQCLAVCEWVRAFIISDYELLVQSIPSGGELPARGGRGPREET